MTKKLSFLMAAISIVVFAVPTAASALPTLQYVANSTLVPTGSNLTGTGENVILTSSLLGQIKCEVLNFKSTISENSSFTGFASKGTKEKPEQKNCTNPNGEVVVNSFTVNTLQSRSSGVAKLNFEANVTIKPTVCTFVGTNVEGTYSNGGSELIFTKAAGITASPSGCGTVKLDGGFTLLEINGTTIKGVKAWF